MPFQRRRKCIFHWRGRAWLTIWDRVKIPWYSHRLMHRRRVTCKLHDSYFCLMTIKHTIPKTAEVHIPIASYGEILSGRELLYNWVHRKFNQSLETRCGRESQHSAESWASGWAAQENGKETLMAIRVGVNMLQFCSVSNSLSHTTLSNKVRGTYFSKELCCSSLLCRYDSACICRYICIMCLYSWSWSWLYNTMSQIDLFMKMFKLFWSTLMHSLFKH